MATLTNLDILGGETVNNRTFRKATIIVLTTIVSVVIFLASVQAQTDTINPIGSIITKDVVNNTTKEKHCDLPSVVLLMIPIVFLLLIVVVGLIDRRQYYIDLANGDVDTGFF